MTSVSTAAAASKPLKLARNSPTPALTLDAFRSFATIGSSGAISVSVRAPDCCLADGLTKVVLNDPELARRLLPKAGAEAFVLTG